VSAPTESSLLQSMRKAVHPLIGEQHEDYEPLLELIGDARFVLLGEASHGTHEFYRERAQITKRLIKVLPQSTVGDLTLSPS
jgi:erythromycin esterase-like protein